MLWSLLFLLGTFYPKAPTGILIQFKPQFELLDTFSEGLQQVSEETNHHLECPLSIQDIHLALQTMQGQKAPGIDGLTVGFHKAFWDISRYPRGVQ